MISVVIPAYNEAERVWPTLSALAQWLPQCFGDAFEVIVVSDGSADETEFIAQRFIRALARFQNPAAQKFRLLKLPENQGKGAAVRAGLLSARGRWRLMFDADGATPIEALALAWPLTQGDSAPDVIIGSRAVHGAAYQVRARAYRRWIGRGVHALIAPLFARGRGSDAKIRDTQCGFKLMTADAVTIAVAPLVLKRYLFDVEMLMRAQAAGLSILEYPVPWAHVTGSKISLFKDFWHVMLELRWLYGFKARVN